MAKRIVVKVGSNVLTRDDGKLDITRMSALVDQVAWLRTHGFEVILITSGAMACGRGELKTNRKLDSVAQRQLFSAVGQVKLINLYYDLFREHNIKIGQVLTMKENFASRSLYLNQRACMSVMLDNGILPVVNENDTVSITELMFTDNDELSGLVASMLDAETLIILSNIDGLYNGAPSAKGSQVIRQVEPGCDLRQYIQTEKSGFGRGGMLTKSNIARKVADEGIRVIIANGKRDDILIRLVTQPEETLHTEFVPSRSEVSNVKKWIAHSESFSKGTAIVTPAAARALQKGSATSLLLVGVNDIKGDFEEGDIIAVEDTEGHKIALGKSGWQSSEARKNIGAHNLKPLIHYDYLYLE